MGEEGGAALIGYLGVKKGVPVGPRTWALGQTDQSSNLDFLIQILGQVSKLVKRSKAPFL